MANTPLPQNVFSAHETNMRFICATSCCTIRKLTASSNVQQAVGQTPTPILQQPVAKITMK
ncbi:TPA: hypothetical protein ACX3E3_004875, partial [Vibrio parahaemolyticus]